MRFLQENVRTIFSENFCLFYTCGCDGYRLLETTKYLSEIKGRALKLCFGRLIFVLLCQFHRGANIHNTCRLRACAYTLPQPPGFLLSLLDSNYWFYTCGWESVGYLELSYYFWKHNGGCSNSCFGMLILVPLSQLHRGAIILQYTLLADFALARTLPQPPGLLLSLFIYISLFYTYGWDGVGLEH